MNWWQYLLLVNVYLILFFGFYALLLRKETFFQLNRVYLVSAALLSFFIPVIQADWVKNLFITQTVHYSIYGGAAVIIYQVKPIADAPFTIGQLLTALYLTGVFFLVARLVWQLISIKKIINQPEQAAAYSFFKKIRMDKQTQGNQIIAAHEQVHAKQWHSADVLIIEAVMIINWFNPVVYFYRYAVKHIHEFIADSHALKAGTNKADYALMLLTQTFNAPSHHLVNSFFNSSLLKQRIIMLQKNKSQRAALIKYGLSAPLFILMLILSSATVNNSGAITRVNKIAKKVFEISADSAMLTHIATVNIKPADSLTVDQKVASANKKIDSAVAKEIKIARVKVIAQADTVSADKNMVFTAVEHEPEFPGGLTAFYDFLSRTIRYPAVDREAKVQGKALITFIVEEDGSLSNIKVLRGPSQTIINESIRAISLSPNWNPGTQNGKKVRVQYTVPVSFTLAGDDDNVKTTGQISNVIVVGAPKTDTSNNKRPVTLMLTGMTAEPLYVIDGKKAKQDDLKAINPADIESINVIKGKPADALYGKEGKDGVIVITLKKKK